MGTIKLQSPEEFRKHIRYKRVRDIFRAAIRVCCDGGYSENDFDLNSIIGYQTTGGTTFPGQPANTPRGWTCFDRNHLAEVYEAPYRKNKKYQSAGIFMCVIYYPDNDEYMILTMSVTANDGWYNGNYAFYDVFNVSWSNERPTIHRFNLNGSQERVWNGTFDSSHNRQAAYAISAKGGYRVLYRKDDPPKGAYYKPSRKKRVARYGSSKKGRN